jgi:hypothetical protein
MTLYFFISTRARWRSRLLRHSACCEADLDILRIYGARDIFNLLLFIAHSDLIAGYALRPRRPAA